MGPVDGADDHCIYFLWLSAPSSGHNTVFSRFTPLLYMKNIRPGDIQVTMERVNVTNPPAQPPRRH